ncbi:MAG: hypothetical protein HZB91_09245 [Elusimicrobia bacterium]|nr:hypothetical protein [Elusimicrobiota bacterium]
MKTTAAFVLLVLACAVVHAEFRVKSGYRGFVVALESWQVRDLVPGDRVDVLSTREVDSKSGERETVTLLQNVLVLRASVGPKGTAFGLVQLMLKPEDAMGLAHAMARGGLIDLGVRSSADSEIQPMERASFRKLFPAQ